MPWLSNKSYARLTRDIDDLGHRLYEALQRGAELSDKNARLVARVRSAERRVQELTLLCGMKGYAVEMTPDTPATPFIPGVPTLTKIQKGNQP
jgi:hypothetical protein